MNIFWYPSSSSLVIYDKFPEVYTFWDNLAQGDQDYLGLCLKESDLSGIGNFLDKFPCPRVCKSMLQIYFVDFRETRKWITSFESCGLPVLLKLTYNPKVNPKEQIYPRELFSPSIRENPGRHITKFYQRILDGEHYIPLSGTGRVGLLLPLMALWWKIKNLT